MHALNLLSEEAHGPDLTWLFIALLVFFVVVVIVGWTVSNKKEETVAKVESVVEKEPAPVAPAAPAKPDDLKKLEGIGPKVAQVLAEAGITTFAELAATDVEKAREVLVAAKLQMMDPSGWIEQAILAANGEWDALEKLQDELKGGRRA